MCGIALGRLPIQHCALEFSIEDNMASNLIYTDTNWEVFPKSFGKKFVGSAKNKNTKKNLEIKFLSFLQNNH